jgi:hypothetical protein
MKLTECMNSFMKDGKVPTKNTEQYNVRGLEINNY